MDILDERVESLERLFFGTSDSSEFSERLVALNNRMDEIYTTKLFPDLKKAEDCIDLENKLYSKQSAILEVGNKMNLLLAKQQEFLNNIKLLENIKSLSNVIDKEFDTGDDNNNNNNRNSNNNNKEIKKRLENVALKLRNLQSINNKQTNEINLLLSHYETMVSALSNKTAEWDDRLRAL